MKAIVWFNVSVCIIIKIWADFACRLSFILSVNIKEERNKISFDEVDDELFAFSQEVSIIDIRFE